MKKILIVFGTRPEALKIYPLIYYAKDFLNLQIESYFTNQHEETYIEFRPDFSAFDTVGTLLPQNFGDIYKNLDWFLSSRDKYDYIMVQGDTFSALAGSLWGYYNQIPVIHIEAGLRTNRDLPFPEEKNREIIDLLSWIRFCPTQQNLENLLILDKERLPKKKNYIVGNTIIDRLKMELDKEIIIESLGNYYVCTLQRRESWKSLERC